MQYRRYIPALAALTIAVLGGSEFARGQSPYPIADQVAAKVIAKYQNTSCQDLAAQKQQPPSGQKEEVMQKAVQQLKQNPQMRQYFINQIAAPIANKLFDCGMIP